MSSLLRRSPKVFSGAFCCSCGEKLPQLGSHAIACPYCGDDLHSRRTDSDITRVFRASPVPSAGHVHRQACTAAFLSLVVPGAGQVFNGHFFRGFIILGTFWMVVPWIFGVIDAWVCARREALTPGTPQVL